VFCARCGAQLARGAGFCLACGAVVPATSRPTTGPALSINFRRLGTGDWVVVLGTVLVFIALFLPWYSFPTGSGTANANAVSTMSSDLTPGALTQSGSTSQEVTGVVSAMTAELTQAESDLCPNLTQSECFSVYGSETLNAVADGAGGFRFLILILDIGIVLYLLARTLVDRARLPLPHWQLLTAATVLNGILVVLAFSAIPYPDIFPKVAWAFGAYWGVVAALIAIVGAVMRRWQPETLSVAVASGAGGAAGPVPVPSSARLSVPPARPAVCPACGAPAPPMGIFCGRCGASITPGGEPPKQAEVTL